MQDTAVCLFEKPSYTVEDSADSLLKTVAGIPLVERTLLSLKKTQIRSVHCFCNQKHYQILQVLSFKWKRDNRFPEVYLHYRDKKTEVHLPPTYLILDGHLIYHPRLLEQAVKLDGPAAYVDDRGQALGIGVLDASQPVQMASLEKVTPYPLTDFSLTPESSSDEGIKKAENRIFALLKKDTDGWFSAHLNRPVSLCLSKTLVRYPIHPNIWTLLTFLFGAISGIFSSFGGYFYLALGGIIYQFASILDGIDGEIARAKFLVSKPGMWLDTVCDDLTNLIYILGVTLGIYRNSKFMPLLVVGIAGGTAYVLLVILMYRKLIYGYRSHTLLRFQQEIKKPGLQKNKRFRFVLRLQPLIKRDFYGYLFMLLALAGVPSVTLVVWLIGVVSTFAVLLRSGFVKL
jgi:phosphatidylglycerophosphate synthase